MARYRKAAATPRVADLRRAPGNASVNVSAASETTDDAPELTDSDIAPEASPAADKPKRTRRTRKAKA